MKLELQARLDSEDQGTSTIVVLGQTVHFSNKTQFEEPISGISDFYNTADIGDVVEIEGTYNSNLQRIEATEVSLETNSQEADSQQPSGDTQAK